MELAVPSVASDNVPDSVYLALLASHAQASQHPVRHAAFSPSGIVTVTRDSGIAHPSRARSEGTMATRDAQAYGEYGARNRGPMRASY